MGFPLADDVRKNQVVVFGCNCSVTYSGRAESFLDYGDRIVVIKADNTLLIHQATGNNPINYMKSGGEVLVSEKDEGVTLQVQHRPLKEQLILDIKQVYFYNAHTLEQENSTLQLQGTEKDMVDNIYVNPTLIEEGFTPVNKEEQTKYGYIDVLGYDTKNNLCVIECKRYTGDFKAVDQLRRYVERIKKAKGIAHVRGILACPEITANALSMLQELGYEHKLVIAPKRLEHFQKEQLKLHQF